MSPFGTPSAEITRWDGPLGGTCSHALPLGPSCKVCVLPPAVLTVGACVVVVAVLGWWGVVWRWLRLWMASCMRVLRTRGRTSAGGSCDCSSCRVCASAGSSAAVSAPAALHAAVGAEGAGGGMGAPTLVGEDFVRAPTPRVLVALEVCAGPNTQATYACLTGGGSWGSRCARPTTSGKASAPKQDALIRKVATLGTQWSSSGSDASGAPPAVIWSRCVWEAAAVCAIAASLLLVLSQTLWRMAAAEASSACCTRALTLMPLTLLGPPAPTALALLIAGLALLAVLPLMLAVLLLAA